MSKSIPVDEAGFALLDEDARAEAYASLIRELRAHISAVCKSENISLRELARRLNVSPSVISRTLSSEGDVLISTLFDLAWALDREWNFKLKLARSKHVTGSRSNHLRSAVDVQKPWVASDVSGDEFKPKGEWKIKKVLEGVGS